MATYIVRHLNCLFYLVFLWIFTCCVYCESLRDLFNSLDNIQPLCFNDECCKEDEFQCGNGHCVALDKVCEANSIPPGTLTFVGSKNYCGDFSDREGCSTEPCASRSQNCDQTCLDLPGNKSRCSCFKGFELKFKNTKYLCTDIDECSFGNHICSHNCVNLNGSFSCTCMNGFGKEVEEREGACKVDDGDIVVLYSSLTRIYSYNVKERRKKTIVWIGNLIGMNYDPKTDIIYWFNDKQLARSYLPGSINGTVTVAHAQILESFVNGDIVKNSLNVDWVGGNLVWLAADVLGTNISRIMMSKLDGRYVKTFLEVPYGTSLTVDPEEGMLYWSSAGSEPKISARVFSGYSTWLLKSIPGQYPAALTMDHQSNSRIYWVDLKSNTVYFFYRSGHGIRKVFTTTQERCPIAIDVFENYIYWLTKSSNELLRRDKFGRGVAEVLASDLFDAYSVKIYHKVKYYRDNQTSADLKCSQLYLHGRYHRQCTCADGSKMVRIQNEDVCSSGVVAAAEDPIICNCKDKVKVCNSSTVHRFCACGQICPDGLSVPDYNDFPESPDNTPLIVYYSVIVVSVTVILLACIVLSFYKRE